MHCGLAYARSHLRQGYIVSLPFSQSINATCPCRRPACTCTECAGTPRRFSSRSDCSRREPGRRYRSNDPCRRSSKIWDRGKPRTHVTPILCPGRSIKLAISTCDPYIATINSFISPVVGSHPQGELNHRTFRKTSVTAISCFWDSSTHGRQGSTGISICGLSSSIGRMSASPATTKSHEKWLKASHARAPIRTGAVTQTLEPVDVERHAFRAEISKRAKNLSAVYGTCPC